MTKMRSSDESSATLVTPSPLEAHGRIVRQLQRAYGHLLAEPIPDKFSQLLASLSDATSSPNGIGKRNQGADERDASDTIDGRTLEQRT